MAIFFPAVVIGASGRLSPEHHAGDRRPGLRAKCLAKVKHPHGVLEISGWKACCFLPKPRGISGCYPHTSRKNGCDSTSCNGCFWWRRVVFDFGALRCGKNSDLGHGQCPISGGLNFATGCGKIEGQFSNNRLFQQGTCTPQFVLNDAIK